MGKSSDIERIKKRSGNEVGKTHAEVHVLTYKFAIPNTQAMITATSIITAPEGKRKICTLQLVPSRFFFSVDHPRNAAKHRPTGLAVDIRWLGCLS